MFEKLKKNPIVYLFVRMWEFGEGKRARMLITMLNSAIAMLIWLTVPLALAKFINAAQRATSVDQLGEVILYLGAIVGIGVLAWCFHGPSRVNENVTAFFVRRAAQLRLLDKVTRLPIKWHQQNHSGETIDKVAKASSALADFTESSYSIVQLLCRFVGSFVMMAIFMPQAALVVSVFTLGVIFLIVAFDRVLVPLYEAGNLVLNKSASRVQDYLTNITTVISLRLEDQVEQGVSKSLAPFESLAKSASTWQEWKWFMTNLGVDLTRVVTLFLFVYQSLGSKGVVEIGTVVALNEYLSTLGSSFFEFTGRWGDYVIKATRLRAVEGIESDYRNLVGALDNSRLPSDWRKLEIEGLSFTYEGSENKSAGLFELSLAFERGKSYAVVGDSGSGKSTLLACLRGLNKVKARRVLCDGCELEFGMRAINHHTTLIPQDPEVFADTVMKNVTMGNEAEVEKVRHALDLARFTPVLGRLPNGLETNIAEKGISLSGGEKQRLALARGVFFAFDSDSDIILLDESTSSVDLINEEIIYRDLLKHFSFDLIVATVHKFNLLPLFDQIIVMKHGKIVERGSLAELIAANAGFAEMWRQYVGSIGLAPDIAQG
jgi:ABC-type multidrug transport system fused ATPase/permease subunit